MSNPYADIREIRSAEELLAHAIEIEREAARKQIKDSMLAEMAAGMAAEEGVHIAWVKSAIRRTPDPVIDWSSVFG